MDDEFDEFENIESSMLFGDVLNEDEYVFLVEEEQLIDVMQEISNEEYLIIHSDVINEALRSILITFSDHVVIRYRNI